MPSSGANATRRKVVAASIGAITALALIVVLMLVNGAASDPSEVNVDQSALGDRTEDPGSAIDALAEAQERAERDEIDRRIGTLQQPVPPATPTSEPIKPQPICPKVLDVGPLRVASFNIHGGVGPRGGFNLAQIANEIRAWELDVVMIQEIHQYRRASGLLDMPNVLAAQLDMDVAFGANFSRNPEGRGAPRRQSGTAILSRFPITEQENTILPNPPGGLQPRGLLRAVVDVEGVEIALYNTHLDNRGRAAREAQGRAVAARVGAEELPSIVGGDFNAGPGQPPINAMNAVAMDAWAAGLGLGQTAPAQRPRARIDFVFYRGEFKPLGSFVRLSSISDHRAVVSDFTLRAVVPCVRGGRS